jgi:hypothetical protein
MVDLASIIVREHVTGSYSVKVWHGDRIVFERWQYASPESAFEQGHVALLAFRKATQAEPSTPSKQDYWEAIALDEQQFS